MTEYSKQEETWEEPVINLTSQLTPRLYLQ